MTGGAGGGATWARASGAQARKARANQKRLWRGLNPSIALEVAIQVPLSQWRRHALAPWEKCVIAKARRSAVSNLLKRVYFGQRQCRLCYSRRERPRYSSPFVLFT